MFGKTPEFVQNHEQKQNPKSGGDAFQIDILPEANSTEPSVIENNRSNLAKQNESIAQKPTSAPDAQKPADRSNAEKSGETKPAEKPKTEKGKETRTAEKILPCLVTCKYRSFKKTISAVDRKSVV